MFLKVLLIGCLSVVHLVQGNNIDLFQNGESDDWVDDAEEYNYNYRNQTLVVLKNYSDCPLNISSSEVRRRGHRYTKLLTTSFLECVINVWKTQDADRRELYSTSNVTWTDNDEEDDRNSPKNKKRELQDYTGGCDYYYNPDSCFTESGYLANVQKCAPTCRCYWQQRSGGSPTCSPSPTWCIQLGYCRNRRRVLNTSVSQQLRHRRRGLLATENDILYEFQTLDGLQRVNMTPAQNRDIWSCACGGLKKKGNELRRKGKYSKFDDKVADDLCSCPNKEMIVFSKNNRV
jgi:hypothetical protein